MASPADPSVPSLTVRRIVRADPERIFELWTRPEHLRRWWGPRGVRCSAAEVDLRPGGRYRIGNQFPDGRMLWIVGEFERVTPPRELVYTWTIDPGAMHPERVTVRFDPHGEGTEVTVVHERIPNRATLEGHESGWRECLDGLEVYLSHSTR
ncbi:MAG: SRPBCC domain-containing protein [Gemmatimonadales bacterium]|nr:SRPBCC domain-containing protein [Gemmatimonadales bacterium]